MARATPTTETYAALQQAFDHFNDRLFNPKLPACLITLQRKESRVLGYYWPERFVAADAAGAVDEIAMNPQHFGRNAEATLSTLVHEMAHLWQFHHGQKKSRAGYHNGEWAQKMEEIGLVPSDTGQPGGKKTGQKLSHYIEADGPFARAAADLLADGDFRLRWREVEDAATAGKKKKPTRHKYLCPTCDLAMWGKPGSRVLCGDCDEPMVEQLPEDDED